MCSPSLIRRYFMSETEKRMAGDYEIVNSIHIGNKEVGEWINSNVFSPGMLYHWNDMIEKATGEKLTAKYYQEEFR